MPTPVEVLTAGSIIRPAEVVALAARAGLELAVAAAMLQKESGGGRNVWGADNVPTGGAYTKGGPVTEANYRAYLAAITAGRAGRNGVGPTQLTYSGFQTLADKRGGCWRWEVNIGVGFEILAGYMRGGDVRDAGARYNGGKPYASSVAAAKRYGDDLLARTNAWRAKLADTASSPAPTPAASSGRPTLREGDTGDLVAAVQRFMNDNFGLYSKIDLRPRRYGPQTVAVIREFQHRSRITGSDADGTIIGPRTWAELERQGFRG